jgi:hypothetical protein
MPGDALFCWQETPENTLLCHAADGYVGYVAADVVERVDGDAFDAHISPPRANPTDEADRRRHRRGDEADGHEVRLGRH